VFFPTARQTQLYAETFSAAGMDVLEIHSRKSQVRGMRRTMHREAGLNQR
jgi:hypothetical protein